uniref:Uncharacterized protein n=1 Tax=Lepeophtheirus salmonis TaxID=72036 RepID=A0A0K2UDC2_LEPSM
MQVYSDRICDTLMLLYRQYECSNNHREVLRSDYPKRVNKTLLSLAQSLLLGIYQRHLQKKTSMAYDTIPDV